MAKKPMVPDKPMMDSYMAKTGTTFVPSMANTTNYSAASITASAAPLAVLRQ